MPIVSLYHRELLRFIRRPLAPASVIALPLVMFLGRQPASARAFEIIGSLTLLLAVIPIADDPRSGFLQGIAASPAPRIALICAKLLALGTIVTINGVLLAALVTF
jgi:hypothetical protein